MAGWSNLNNETKSWPYRHTSTASLSVKCAVVVTRWVCRSVFYAEWVFLCYLLVWIRSASWAFLPCVASIPKLKSIPCLFTTQTFAIKTSLSGSFSNQLSCKHWTITRFIFLCCCLLYESQLYPKRLFWSALSEAVFCFLTLNTFRAAMDLGLLSKQARAELYGEWGSAWLIGTTVLLLLFTKKDRPKLPPKMPTSGPQIGILEGWNDRF